MAKEQQGNHYGQSGMDNGERAECDEKDSKALIVLQGYSKDLGLTSE